MSEYDLRLVVFDVDGTLVDSVGNICTAVNMAFEAIGKTPPPRDAVLAEIGLPIPSLFGRLALANHGGDHAALLKAYDRAFADLMAQHGATDTLPLFPGARETVQALHEDPWTLLAVATGMSRNGVDQVIKDHGMQNWFSSVQTPDLQCSKPSPEMLQAIIRETGVPLARVVMVGDTVSDIQMAQAAGVKCIAVSWGYHSVAALESAKPDRFINSFNELPAALDDVFGVEI